jgi:hypothetical protein
MYFFISLGLASVDEPVIALDLKLSVEDAGGEVIGPVGSVEAAFELPEKKPSRPWSLTFNSATVTSRRWLSKQAWNPDGLPKGRQYSVGLATSMPNVVHYKKPVSARKKIAELIDG